MSAVKLRAEIKKAIDRLPPERLESLADYVGFLSRPSIHQRILEARNAIAAGKKGELAESPDRCLKASCRPKRKRFSRTPTVRWPESSHGALSSLSESRVGIRTSSASAVNSQDRFVAESGTGALFMRLMENIDRMNVLVIAHRREVYE